ncbi:MAG: hypothetical protein HC932_05470 [Thermales bacterium]|nr:hypothetical protein [Thermales bacterium]
MRVIDHQTKSVFDYITEGRQEVVFGDKKINAYGYLKGYLFDSKMIQKSVASLSGGQRARLMLANELKKGEIFWFWMNLLMILTCK